MLFLQMTKYRPIAKAGIRCVHAVAAKRGRGRGPREAREGEGEVGDSAHTRNIPCLSGTTSPTHCFAMGPFPPRRGGEDSEQMTSDV
jgi:hypothetical protein